MRAKELKRRHGVGGLRFALPHIRRSLRASRDYRRWMERNKVDASDIKEQIDALDSRPLISVILPVFNVDEKWLRLCIESVIAQVYPDWELCIADDASTAPHVRQVLEEYAAEDSRIKVIFRENNGHISAASNSALELATADYLALLDHDDELSRDALFQVATIINASPDAALIYSDEDLIDERGRRSDPKFKPEFSRELFYSFNLTTHLSVFRRDLVREIGGFRIGFEGSQDYDLALRVLERVDEKQIRHIPRVLYHWRTIPGSVASSMDEKPYAHERARAAIREHFQRTGVRAEVHESSHHLHRVSYSKGQDWSTDVIPVDAGKAATASRLNSSAALSDLDVLIFLEDGLGALSRNDRSELAGFAMQPGIGAVGGRVLLPSRFVEEAGLVLGADLMPYHAHQGYPEDTPGNMSRNRQISNYSAISISCFAIRRELFEAMGGFETSSELFDVDLCLRLREQGKRIVVLPHVELHRRRHAPINRVSRAALADLRRRWPEYTPLDPFCNVNLKRDGSFEIDV